MDANPSSSSPSAGPARPSGPRLVDTPALTLAGFGVRYRPEALDEIPAQWGRFGAQVGEVSEPKGPAAFGLCHEWRDGEMEYVCAIQAAPGARVPRGWRLLELPAQRYAVFAHPGHVSEYRQALSWVLGEWLPASGHRRARGFAGGVEILERYGPGFDPATGLGELEIWLPIEP